MGLRQVDEGIGLPDLADLKNKREWHTIVCKLETPLHGGGVKLRESDSEMPIRASSIRGQLRFWWRLLAQYHSNRDIWDFGKEDLRRQEFALWGGMNDGDEAGKASLVFLRVKNNGTLADSKLSNYQTVSYALFTARGDKKNKEMKLGKEGFEWDLEYAFSKAITEQQKQQFNETLRWWVTLGGIGGRTRRGCGVFSAKDVSLVSEQEMRDLGCTIVFLGDVREKIQSAWQDAINQWKDIRKNELNKRRFKKIEDKNSRHLATVLSKPVPHDNGKWRGMIIVLPNRSKEVGEIFGGKS